MGFRQRLAARQQAVNSLVCVGLDPLPERMPALFAEITQAATKVADWMMHVVDITAEYACMFKPQSGYWEAIPGGREAMQAVIAYIHRHYPDIPVFLDCKRGDIGRTQEQYRQAHFGLDGVDGMNYNPYMGKDCLIGLIDPDYMGRALVGLGRTSNPEAWEVQELALASGELLWERIARLVVQWSREASVLADAGLVMGAAHAHPLDKTRVYADHLKQCRQIVGDDLWFLIPGIGTQGGFVEETVIHSFTGAGSIAINSSSGIIFALDPAAAAANLRDQIRAAGGGDLS